MNLASLAVGLQHSCRAIECLGEDRDLLLQPIHITGIDCLVHTGYHDRGVAGVNAWSIDRMPEPGTIWEPLRDEQRTLGVAQCAIQARQI